METEIRVDELVNPARCEVCEEKARWWVTVGPDDDYTSHYYCDDDLPTEED